MGIFGRLQSWKGPQVLCDALALLGEAAPGCDWYGAAKPWPDSNEPADARLARAFPSVWNRAFQFHGPIDRIDVARRMAASRAVIVPSTWDVFNFTAVEAMAVARPVIVSSGAGASELIVHGVNGFTFPAGDAAALAAALEAAAALSDSAARAMGEAARATVGQELDPDRIAAQRLAAYRSAVADHSPTPAPDWLRDLLVPGAPTRWRMEDFLATLPVRPLARAVAERITGKLPGKRGRR